jgi:hypothetical protein
MLWKRSRNSEWNTRDDVEYSLFVVAAVFLSPVSWQHYLPIFLLPITLISKDAIEKQNSRYLAFILLLLASFSIPDHAVVSFFTIVQRTSDFAWAGF